MVRLPAFAPIPAHCRINECDSTTASMHIWFDEIFENDVDSLHRENIVIFTQSQWEQIKSELTPFPTTTGEQK